MAWLLAQEPGGGEAGTANSLDRGHVGCRHRADLLGLLQSMFLVEGFFFFLFILDTKKRWLCLGPHEGEGCSLGSPQRKFWRAERVRRAREGVKQGGMSLAGLRPAALVSSPPCGLPGAPWKSTPTLSAQWRRPQL